MNRATSRTRAANNKNLNNRSNSRVSNPNALQGVNSNRHAPSAGEQRQGHRANNYLRKGNSQSNSGGINLDNFTTSQKNINNAILEYL